MRIQGTYNKFINIQAQKGKVSVISPDKAMRIDEKIADSFHRAAKKALKKQRNSENLLKNREIYG